MGRIGEDEKGGNKMKKKIKEYLTLSVRDNAWLTEDILNKHAEEGWKLVCSYSKGYYLIMERDKEIETCKHCGK
jgi:hypothetical protein